MGVFRRNTAEKYFVYNSSQLKKHISASQLHKKLIFLQQRIAQWQNAK